MLPAACGLLLQLQSEVKDDMTFARAFQAVPRNDGEKNYLECLFRKPKYPITGLYAANGVLLYSSC